METIQMEALQYAFKKRNMHCYYGNTSAETFAFLDQFISQGNTVGCGDSVTLEELNVYTYLRNRKDISFYDKYEKGLSKEEKREIYIKNFDSDIFITGTNAITADGQIFNIDGNGSRVAPMIYGPRKVLIIVGENKIVDTLDDAIKRARQIAAPLDVKRLGKNTPCAITGNCVDCKSKDRICNSFVTISGQFDPDRIHVLILPGHYGY